MARESHPIIQGLEPANQVSAGEFAQGRFLTRLAPPAEHAGPAGQDQVATFLHIVPQQGSLAIGEDGGMRKQHHRKLSQPFERHILIQHNAPGDMFVDQGLVGALEALEVFRRLLAPEPVPRSAAEKRLEKPLFVQWALRIVSVMSDSGGHFTAGVNV